MGETGSETTLRHKLSKTLWIFTCDSCSMRITKKVEELQSSFAKEKITYIFTDFEGGVFELKFTEESMTTLAEFLMHELGMSND